MLFETDIVIIGGGLAGLTSAIHLTKVGLKVTLIEKNSYPHHKVCGEYISNEVLDYFKWLDVDPSVLGPSSISKLQFSTKNGEMIAGNLPLGGFGISRYVLDQHLYNHAKSLGCVMIQGVVNNVRFLENYFEVTTTKDTFKSDIVLGAYGKRASLDHKLNRSFITQKSPWLAIKAHYKGVFPENLVALHNFKGGYCGVSRIEDNLINICYLVNYKTFKKYKNVKEFQEQVLYKNKHLQQIFQSSSMIFETPLSISQISFENKKSVEDHILMIGDTAGLIHPLCGNGMSMAIHSAKIISELVYTYFNTNKKSRKDLEKAYHKAWTANFKSRMRMGNILSTVMQKQLLSKIVLYCLVRSPALFRYIIKHTHGKPISITS
jgi:flavin-dependent dehydrogenase